MIAPESDLAKAMRAIDWSRYLSYGTVKVQVTDGKPSMVTVERSEKLS